MAAPETLAAFATAQEQAWKSGRNTASPAESLTAARQAVDEIRARAAGATTDDARAALTTAKRLAYNAAADAWPGWTNPPADIATSTLCEALALAEISAALVDHLALGPSQQGHAAWLTGALHLALGDRPTAVTHFTRARNAHTEPDMNLLCDGYIALAATPSDAPAFTQATSALKAGNLKYGGELAEQLDIARAVYGLG